MEAKWKRPIITSTLTIVDKSIAYRKENIRTWECMLAAHVHRSFFARMNVHVRRALLKLRLELAAIRCKEENQVRWVVLEFVFEYDR